MNTKKTCSLDPLPTSEFLPCFQSLAPAYTHIINMTLSLSLRVKFHHRLKRIFTTLNVFTKNFTSQIYLLCGVTHFFLLST